MLADHRLPRDLKTLLSDPQVKKVGRMVDSDLCYLQKEVHSHQPFVGGIDLAKLAKEHSIVPNARVGLGDVCAAVLGKRLNKNVPQCVSTQWDNEILDKDQLNYAALDAYASLLIYEALKRIPAPGPLPKILFHRLQSFSIRLTTQKSLHVG